jgi:hypothetical protein
MFCPAAPDFHRARYFNPSRQKFRNPIDFKSRGLKVAIRPFEQARFSTA